MASARRCRVFAGTIETLSQRGSYWQPEITGRQAVTTFILIHGAFQGGWIWKPVATRLRAAGHLVFAPTLDGCGERAY